MNVSLTPQLERFVQSKVKSGRYSSSSEVVREALRLLEEHEKARAAQLRDYQAELDRRLAAPESESVDGESFFRQLRLKSREHRSKRT